MSPPASTADEQMELLLQHIVTNYEMVKGEESKHMIIELLRFVIHAIQCLTKAETLAGKSEWPFGKTHTGPP